MKKNILSLMDHLNLVVEEYAREILQYTPQLFLKEHGQTENVNVSANASGVLIECQNQYFMITAGHVLEENDAEDVGIMIGNVFNILNGEVKFVKPSVDEQSDKTDIAVWKFDNKTVDNIKPHFKFLNINQFGLDHKLQDSDPRYLIVGFPWRKSKLNPIKKKIKVEPFVFLTKNAHKDVYGALKLEKFSNIILEYQQRKIKNFDTGHVTKGITPEGISGCGVWYLEQFFYQHGRPIDFKLLGIITQQDPNKRFLQSTRIDIINEVLIRDFKFNIPRSTIVKLI